MKKMYFILMCFVFYLIGTNSIPVNAWVNEQHQELVEANSSYGRLTPSQKKLVKYCAVIADRGVYKGGRLHGTGNYIKSMELLYTCAYNLKNNVTNPIQSALDPEYTEPGYLKLYEKVNHLLNDKLIPGEEEKSNTAKSAKVLGFACHLAGDIYAHRTIIPQYADKEIFESTWFTWARKYRTKYPHKAKDLPSFDKLMGTTLDQDGKGTRSIQSGKAIFLRIQSWNSENDPKRKYRKYSAQAFEDNPSFFSERYKVGAMELTRALMTLYGKNLPFDEKAIFTNPCSIPLEPAEKQKK